MLRFGPTIPRPPFLPELPTCQFYLDGKVSCDYSPMPLYQMKPGQTFYIHCPCTINCASPQYDRTYIVQKMVNEISAYPAACVLHIGAIGSLGLVAKRLNKLRLKYSKLPCSLLLEPPAGEGTKLGASWDELRKLFEMLDRTNPIGLCLDTQHMFGAGMCRWDSAADVDKVFEEASHIARLGMIHLNDSNVPFADKNDRHAPLGTGYIWSRQIESLQRLFEYSIQGMDLISETSDYDSDYRLAMKLLQKNSE